MTYYRKSTNVPLPKFYQKDLGIYWDYIEGILCDLQTNEPIIANKRQSMSPTYKTIMGNTMHALLFSGQSRRSEVFKIRKTLKEYFLSHMKVMKIAKIKTYPIILELKFYVDLTNMTMDEDGIRLFYDKVFRDCIQESVYSEAKSKGERPIIVANPYGIIPNDSIKYITGSSFRVFHTDKEPYLVAKFWNYSNQIEREADYRNILYGEAIMTDNAKIVEIATTLAKKWFKGFPYTEEAFNEKYAEYFELISNYY